MNIFEFFLKLPGYMQIAFGVAIILVLIIFAIRTGKALNKLLNKKITFEKGKIQIVEQPRTKRERASDNDRK